MGKTQFKRLLRSPEKKEARADVTAAKPPETTDIPNAEEKRIASDAAEPSPDADRPKWSCPDVGVAVVGNADSGQSGSSSDAEAEPRQSDENGSVGSPLDEGAAGERTGGQPVEVYDDVTVCRLLKVRRKVLADARKKATRGVDWDFAGLHAGMTKAWIDRYAIEHGIVPDFFAVPMTPIRSDDEIATVRFVSGHPNVCICAVEVLATGETRYAHVRNQYQFPIYKNEQFDCKVVEGRLEWISRWNAVERY